MLPSNWFENSACKGCSYGERITGGVFCNEIQGLVPVGYQGCKAQNDFCDDQRKEEMGITLNELMLRLIELFEFKYLTVDNLRPGDRDLEIALWEGMPELDENDHWVGNQSGYVFSFHEYNMLFNLNLSEYADEHGEIDYSKCIVEVE